MEEKTVSSFYPTFPFVQMLIKKVNCANTQGHKSTRSGENLKNMHSSLLGNPRPLFAIFFSDYNFSSVFPKRKNVKAEKASKKNCC